MSSKQIVLTGITPSGIPHLGNYIGAIKPALDLANNPNYQARYFIADYHSLIKLWDPKLRQDYIYDVAATWLACGLDPKKVIFYRQSDIPEILELTWILTSVAAKGLLNRAHAYKALVAQNEEANKQDPDAGITMGLFNYPILMAADILAFHTNLVPVGKDQIQHIEIARDIANRLNHIYQKELLVTPEALVEKKTQTIPGLDGRKMSKSYQNTIPIFIEPKKMRKLMMKIVTNSQPPEEPKETTDCTLFNLYQAFASESEAQAIAKRYAEGIGWGEMKQILYEKVSTALAEPYQYYLELINDKKTIDAILKEGSEQARAIARPLLDDIRKTVGI
ncbi:tryptophan--tRNA ligase [Thiotrichales bacterium 19S3-7]|nr:tryptophan--tRNA ligase [Thiotrichales bacterium 19S3-7]MCF6802500.1 tryptophan--tRNA ligase [Thiotrichales bacterium 19S3-11]